MDEQTPNLPAVEDPIERQRRIREQKLKNLRMFPKGVSGNPKGKPSHKAVLTDMLRKELNKLCPEDKKGRTYKELIILAALRGAIKGDKAVLGLVFDRIDGKVPDKLDLRGDGGGPALFRLVHDEKIQEENE